MATLPTGTTRTTHGVSPSNTPTPVQTGPHIYSRKTQQSSALQTGTAPWSSRNRTAGLTGLLSVGHRGGPGVRIFDKAAQQQALLGGGVIPRAGPNPGVTGQGHGPSGSSPRLACREWIGWAQGAFPAVLAKTLSHQRAQQTCRAKASCKQKEGQQHSSKQTRHSSPPPPSIKQIHRYSRKR